MTQAEAWSLVASAVSIALGVLAIGLSVAFYLAGRRTEAAVSAALTGIQSQAEMLQKLTVRQLDRLTRFVTTERPSTSEEITQLLVSFTEIARPLAASLHERGDDGSLEEARSELITCYIAIYYYCALTNFWAQHYLPNASDFDEQNEFHQQVRRIVDTSATDFSHLARILSEVEHAQLAANPLANLLVEARDEWRTSVRTAAEVFVARTREA
jgi:hypothetical protein